MPPWGQMSQADQMRLMQLLMNRGIGGMQQPGMGNIYNALLAQQMGQQAQGGAGQAQGGGLAQDPALMQYLMGMFGGGQPGMGGQQGPTLAQLLALRGGNTAQQGMLPTLGFPQ